MGLADEFFWNLTPVLFEMLVEQYRNREHRANLRSGLIAAELRNANRTKTTDKLWVASDFFEERQSQKEEQTDEEMLMAMNAWVTRTKHSQRN